MIDKAQSLFRLLQEENAIIALLRAGEYALPSPYKEQFAFTKRFFRQLPEAPSSWGTRLWMWRHGFVPQSFNLYDFETYDTDAYFTDLEEEFGSHIDRPSKDHLDDKRKFYDLLEDRGFGDHLPARYGALSDGVLVGPGSDFVNLLDEKGALVVKGRTGEGGKTIRICRSDGDAYRIDDEILSASSVRDRIAELDGHLVMEYCTQHEYAESIYAETANTIRIVTMNPADGEPFVSGTAHRFGTSSSAPLDSFDRGGLAASISDTGRLSPAVQYSSGTVSWHEHHPDTGSAIAGTSVPEWRSIERTVLSMASALPELPYIGWDVLVTDRGEIKIIEGNSNSGTHMFQVYNPLLLDDRTRRFYAESGILGTKPVRSAACGAPVSPPVPGSRR